MLSRICGTFHPLESLYLKVCGLLCWNEGPDSNLWMSAFSNPNEIMGTVNWCNKSSGLSYDVSLKAVMGRPSNHLIHWVDIIKGGQWQLLYDMEDIHASMSAALIRLPRNKAGSPFSRYLLVYSLKCNCGNANLERSNFSNSYGNKLLLELFLDKVISYHYLTNQYVH